jgi:hypothetical protein
MYRHELGDITLSLKTIAVTHEIPILTVTQLNRGVYNVKSSEDLRLDMMSESMQKVNHSDYISLQAKDLTDDNIVHFAVGKNRSGVSDVGMDFKVDFSKYKFIKSIINANSNINTNTNKHPNTKDVKNIRNSMPLPSNILLPEALSGMEI